MLKVILARQQQKYRTYSYPKKAPVLPDGFQGLPVLNPERCVAGCSRCAEVCPTGAIATETGKLFLDTGRCLFCAKCVDACEVGAVSFSRCWRMAAAGRNNLVIRDDAGEPAAALNQTAKRLFSRSLKLRQVSAGGCNACEADCNVLSTLAFDLGRFGIQFVASPRHADGLLITGPVTENMKLALEKTYAAVPEPKIVIAAGACAISGGLYAGHAETCSGAAGIVPVDLFIPGCPPNPWTILDGLLRFIGRIPECDV